MSHSILAPSASHRWRKCAGSMWLCRGIEDSGSAEAKEGTFAHAIGAKCLEQGCDAKVFHNVEFTYECDGEMVTAVPPPEMLEYVQTGYLDPVRKQFTGADEIIIERRVDLSAVYGVEDQGGTADVILVKSEIGELQVHDLKYGKGVKVEAEDNSQLFIYAAGALQEVEALMGRFIEKITMCIHQPRNGGSSGWELTREEFDAELQRVYVDAQAAAHAYNCKEHPGDDAFHPGEHQCAFCPAKKRCEYRVKYAENEVEAQFDVIESVETAIAERPGVSDEKLARMLAAVPFIKKLCSDIEDEAYSRAMAGVALEGFKLVEKPAGNRAWTDEKEVEKKLKSMKLRNDEMYKQSLISVAVAEKVLKGSPKKWKKLDEFITRGGTKIVLLPRSAKGDEYFLKPVEAEFEVIEEADIMEDLGI